MRGALLGLIATFAGMIIFTAPESIMQLCKIPMPELIQSQPGLLVRDFMGTGEQERAPAVMQGGHQGQKPGQVLARDRACYGTTSVAQIAFSSVV